MINSANQNQRQWKLKYDDTEDNLRIRNDISSRLGIGEVLSQLLINRGCCTADEAGAFIRMEKEMLHAPFIINDMERAIERINKAICDREKIVIYGDYDVDGVTSVCTLFTYLSEKGACVSYYIPNRIGEGYGVSVGAINKIADDGVELIITVDTGVTACDEVEYAKGLGIDFVITDHHECPEVLPSAVAVVNPHRRDCEYPFKELAGVGVVFKLISAYEEKYSGKARLDALSDICDKYADLIAIGTIADVMPIKDENKLIVSYGLAQIGNTKRVGLRTLINSLTSKIGESVVVSHKRMVQKPVKITSSYIGFTLAPRINAAGRMRSASIAVELFLEKDEARACELVRELCDANKERQEEENRITREAYEMIPADYDAEKYPVIVLGNDDWHHGVIGIVCSRITEKFGLPSILVSFDGNDPTSPLPTDIGKGSGRSVKGLNLMEALTHCSDSLVKFGGHELAAGLSVERGCLDAFREEINAYAREVLRNNEYIPVLEADMELSSSLINMDTAEQISLLEPFGTENPIPVFILRDAQILEINPISDGKHTRLTVKSDNSVFTAMFFSHSPSSIGLFVGERADIMFNLDINEWNGRRSIQLVVRDIHIAISEEKKLKESSEKFLRIWSGEEYSSSDDILPDRADFAAVYNLVRNSIRAGITELGLLQMLRKLKSTYNGNIGYVKLKFIIKIFQEMNLLGITEQDTDVYHFRLKFSNTKTDLEKSNLLRRLRQQQRNG